MRKQNNGHKKTIAWIAAALVAILFAATVSLIVEARHADFYGEPLPYKMASLLHTKIYGLPEDPDQRARTVTGVRNVYYLPPAAVLPEAPAARFSRIGLRFGYVTEDAVLGRGRYTCTASDIEKIPLAALNIAMALERIPDNVLSKMKFEYVVFCGDLRKGSTSVGGFPVPPNNLMFLNLTRRSSDGKIQALFFHEFYHMFEARFGLVHDANWLQYFGEGYQNSYAGFATPGNKEFGSGGFGFLNGYSRSYPHEERAELFSALMLSRDQLAYYIRQKNDEMLAAKAEYVAGNARKHLEMEIEPLWE